MCTPGSVVVHRLFLNADWIAIWEVTWTSKEVHARGDIIIYGDREDIRSRIEEMYRQNFTRVNERMEICKSF